MDMEIVTARLSLRSFLDEDLPALADLFADGAVQQHLAVGPMGPSGAREFAATFIRNSHDEWREGGCGVLSVVPRSGDGEVEVGARASPPGRPGPSWNGVLTI